MDRDYTMDEEDGLSAWSTTPRFTAFNLVTPILAETSNKNVEKYNGAPTITGKGY